MTDQFTASVQRAERDAIKSASGNCSGLGVLNAGNLNPALIPRLDGADLRVFDLARRLGASGDASSDTGEPPLLPFHDQDFDCAISAQVLPHISGAERRSEYLREVSRVLKPGGRLIVTTMHFSFRFQRNGALKEGWDDGVYYHRYFVDEFHDELQPWFTVERLHGFWIYLPKTFRLYMSLGSANVFWERALRNRPLSLKYGKFLLAVCRPKQKVAA